MLKVIKKKQKLGFIILSGSDKSSLSHQVSIIKTVQFITRRNGSSYEVVSRTRIGIEHSSQNLNKKQSYNQSRMNQDFPNIKYYLPNNIFNIKQLDKLTVHKS